jgi:hypothetical protein
MMLGKHLQSPQQQFRCSRKPNQLNKARMTACKAANGSTQRKAQLKVQGMKDYCWCMGSQPCAPQQQVADFKSSFSAARRASDEDKKKLIDSVDCFIFDCDGEGCTCLHGRGNCTQNMQSSLPAVANAVFGMGNLIYGDS